MATVDNQANQANSQNLQASLYQDKLKSALLKINATKIQIDAVNIAYRYGVKYEDQEDPDYEGRVEFTLDNKKHEYTSVETFSDENQARELISLQVLIELNLLPIIKSKIYTQTGDSGTSSLYTGERRPKTDLIFDVLGQIDELNAWIGLIDSSESVFQIESPEIQSMLQDIASYIATPDSDDSDDNEEKLKKVDLSTFNEHPSDATTELENCIDYQEMLMGSLTRFILPSGCKKSRQIHVCRTIARKTERLLCQYIEKNHITDQDSRNISKYMNRLSDYLFSLARFTNYINNYKEQIYKKPLKN